MQYSISIKLFDWGAAAEGQALDSGIQITYARQ